MASYNLSNEADADLDQIYESSFLNFGLEQTQKYFLGFHECFRTLAENPRLGRDYSHVKKGYRRHEYQSHSVYYMITAPDILVVKILHKNQDPGKNL